jgi:hypothetical protein
MIYFFYFHLLIQNEHFNVQMYIFKEVDNQIDS